MTDDYTVPVRDLICCKGELLSMTSSKEAPEKCNFGLEACLELSGWTYQVIDRDGSEGPARYPLSSYLKAEGLIAADCVTLTEDQWKDFVAIADIKGADYRRNRARARDRALPKAC